MFSAATQRPFFSSDWATTTAAVKKWSKEVNRDDISHRCINSHCYDPLLFCVSPFCMPVPNATCWCISRMSIMSMRSCIIYLGFCTFAPVRRLQYLKLKLGPSNATLPGRRIHTSGAHGYAPTPLHHGSAASREHTCQKKSHRVTGLKSWWRVREPRLN